MKPSLLDSSWKDSAQSLVNRWQETLSRANSKINELEVELENIEKFLSDVDRTIEWLRQNQIFDSLRNAKVKFQKESDSSKKMEIIQV